MALPLSLVAYQQLSVLYASVSTQHYPNAAVVKTEAKGNATHEQQLIDYQLTDSTIEWQSTKVQVLLGIKD